MSSVLFRGASVFLGPGFDETDVLVEDGHIVAIGTGIEGDQVIDCRDLSILPGMIDCHTHLGFPDIGSLNPDHVSVHRDEDVLRFADTARRTLSLGITAVRDAGGASVGMRSALDKGFVIGPRMQTAVVMLSMTGGHADGYEAQGADPRGLARVPGYPDPLCDGVEGCIRKTREVIRSGADVVKISASGGFLSPNDDPEHPNFLQEEMDAIVRTAADLGRPVMAHAHGAEAIKRAVRAGVRSIEHGTFLDEEGAEMMAAAGTWLVSTMTAGDGTELMLADPATPPSIRAKLEHLGFPERDAFAMAVGKGVKIAMGTDCPVAPHGTNLRELELMTANGLSAEQSLTAATKWSSELTGLDDRIGAVAVGLEADLVVVSGDPLDFTTLAGRVEQVWMRGRQLV